jgi:hypothetical protein
MALQLWNPERTLADPQNLDQNRNLLGQPLLYSVRAALPIEQRCGNRRSERSEAPVSMGFGGAGPLRKATKDVYKRSFVDIFGVCTNAPPMLRDAANGP